MNCTPSAGETAEYATNEFFAAKMNSGKHLLTTRHGAFVFLDDKEYELLTCAGFGENRGLLERLSDAGIILTKKNIPAIIRSLEKQVLFMMAPKSYIINVSDECNMGCIYCHANSATKKSKTMSDETIGKTCEFILSAAQDTLYIEFQGGEPLAKFDVITEIIAKLKGGAEKSGKKINAIVVVTNMTLMTEEIARYVIANKIGICSSLDGPEKLHDLHRTLATGGGSYKEATRWIPYFRERKKAINLLPTVTAHSLKFGAKSIVDEYLRWGCRKIMFRPVYGIGRARPNKSIHVSAGDFIDFLQEGIEYMVELSLKSELVYDPATQARIRNMLGYPQSYMCMRKPCGAGISQISISPDGRIFPCDLGKTMPELAIGSVYDGHAEVFAKALPLYARTCESQPLCDTCAYGAYCGSCISRTYAAFRDTIPRTPSDFDCKVNKAMFTYLFEKMQHEKYRKVFELWASQKR